jgi:Protein of unknown function (DUF2948)
MIDAPAPAKPLRLMAEDAQDLEVISAALQDAVAKIADLSFEPGPRRFTLAVNRFRWEAGDKPPERVRAALQFAGVMGVKSRGAPIGNPRAVVSILAIGFEPTGGLEDPSGVVHLKLAGGGDIRLEVECVDAMLADLSEPWAAIRAPRHRA